MTTDGNKPPQWDLSLLFDGVDDPRIKEDLDRIVDRAKVFQDKYKGRIAGLDDRELAQALKDYEAVAAGPLRAFGFAHLGFAADSKNHEIVVLLQKIKELATAAHMRCIFFDLELDTIGDDRYEELLAAETLAPYRHYLTQLRKGKPHRLSEQEEAILSLKGLSGKSAFVQLYSTLTSSFRFHFTLDGEEKEYTDAELRALAKHPDREVRRDAAKVYGAKHEENAISLSSIWNALALDHRQNNDLRSFAHPMEPVHLGNELTAKAVEKMMEVTRENYRLGRKYYEWKATILGVDKLWSSDLLAPIPGDDAEEIDFPTAKMWVLEAYEAFHPKMAEIARSFFDEKRIDAPTRPGKSGGAFCMGVSPELPVYVLLNFTGKMRDAATLAHELGHGIHFTLARLQPLLEYGPVLPVAETASVFGELLLYKRMMSEEMSPATRRALLAERIEDMMATTFRQAMYTDFELKAHLASAEEHLSSERFCELWTETVEELYGDSVELVEGGQWSWSAIPHFIHTRFYCYAYVFGELLVLALFNRYKEEGDDFAPKLIELLSVGGSKTPQEMLIGLGYDLEDPEFWRGGYKVLEELIDEIATIEV